MTMQALLTDLTARFNASAAADMDEVFQYHIEGQEDFHHVIADGNCQLCSGEHDDPSISFSMDGQTLSEIVSGETDGMQAFMENRVRVEGDMMLASRLNELFPMA